jgi:hypothetical protein
MNAGLSLSEDLAASGSASISGDVTGKNITTENLDIKKTLGSADNALINFYKDPNENPVAYIWLNTAPGTSPDMLRLGSGSGRTSWTIGLRDKITGHQTNQLSYGFSGVDQQSLVGINYDDVAGFNNPNLNSLLRIQKGGTTNSQLLYTKDGVLSVGNSNTAVENNGGYRLDINGNGLFRGSKVTANGDLLVDGKIGLGTSTPTFALDIGDGTVNNFIRLQHDGDTLYIGKSGNPQFGQAETNVIKSSGGSKKLAIGSDDDSADAGLFLGCGSGNDPVLSIQRNTGANKPLLSFFNNTPVEQQSASDIGQVIDALKAYGLLTP